MKRINASKAWNGTVYLAVALLLTSCSSVLLHRDQTVDSTLQGGVNTVPKEQYDEMVRKYQELLEKSKQQEKAGPTTLPAVASSISEEHNSEQKKPQLEGSTVIDPSELVNKIDSSIPDAVSDTPVIKPEITTPVVTSTGVQTVNNSDEIDDQIIRLREAQENIKVNKFENALVILKELETSREKQIVVRAKMMLGDLLFNQGEFDLASQVYEEVINKYAFSGLVLKALGKLIVCSEKLKQPERQAKYYSLLHDFFEAG